MPDVVRGDRDDVARTDRKEGLRRKDGVPVERLVRRGGLAASPDDCPQLGSAAAIPALRFFLGKDACFDLAFRKSLAQNASLDLPS